MGLVEPYHLHTDGIVASALLELLRYVFAAERFAAAHQSLSPQREAEG